MSRFILLEAENFAMDSHLQRLQDALTAAMRGMTAEQLTWHPEGKWSAAEVLEHLYLSYRGTVKGIERCLQAKKPLARTPTLRERWMTTVVVGIGFMPSGQKAPQVAVTRGIPVEQVSKGIAAQIVAMDDALQRCETQFGTRTPVLDHPILGPLSTRQWRKLHWVHGRHHVKQIWKLREQGVSRS